MRFACIVLAFLCTVACGFVGERLQTGDLVFVGETEGGAGQCAMYCSELIREAFRRPDGSPLFETAPMNFLASDGSVPSYWKQLFESLGMEVPQGVAGTNPQDLSISPLLVEVNVSL